MYEFLVGDIIQLKQEHICHKSNFWEVLRIKKDEVFLKCLGCGETLSFSRNELDQKFERRLYEIQRRGISRKIVSESFDMLRLNDKLYLYRRFKSRKSLNTKDYQIWIVKGIYKDEITIICPKTNDRRIIKKQDFASTVMVNRSAQIEKREKIETKSSKNDDRAKLHQSGFKLGDIVTFNDKSKWKIIELNEQIKLRNCDTSRRNSKKIISYSEFFATCPKKVDIAILSKKETPVYNKFDCKNSESNYFEPTRIEIKPQKYTSIVSASKTELLTFNLQLVDSSSNHSTRGHQVTDVVLRLPFQKPDSNQIQVLELKAHRCLDCDKDFDFHASFLEQLKRVNIQIEELKIQLLIHNQIYDFRVQSEPFSTFNKESFLHTLGYHVGVNADSDLQRQELLKKIVDSKVMSISEIKSVINQDIRLFSKRKEYHLAIQQWKDDIQFLNGLISKW